VATVSISASTAQLRYGRSFEQIIGSSPALEAVAQKPGRFEVAHRGTLFLDEAGDIPLSLQPKLLRVLQEQEFERLGSGVTHHADVGLVAATNRNLAEMVVGGKFRSDLNYRLNVFPIELPPLGERRDDIPVLGEHFVGMFSRRMEKHIDYVPSDVMNGLEAYSWPENVRELRNLIERIVIMADEGVLPDPLPGPISPRICSSSEPEMATYRAAHRFAAPRSGRNYSDRQRDD